MNQTADVIVVGAGVVGCSVAYYLASSGAKVALVEREAIGSGASAHATGSLSILGAEFSPGASFELALAGYRQFIDLVESFRQGVLRKQLGCDGAAVTSEKCRARMVGSEF